MITLLFEYHGVLPFISWICMFIFMISWAIYWGTKP